MSKSCILTVTQGDFLYIKEWIEFHHSIGVDLLLIGYNGKAEDFNKLPKYDYVKYFDFSFNDNEIHDNLNASKMGCFSSFSSLEEIKTNCKIPQTNMFNTLLACVKHIYKNIDYTIIIDTDEFINIKNNSNINEFLDENFDKNNLSCMIKMCFYNTENIYYEDKPCQERFTNGFFLENGREHDLGCFKTIINNKHEQFFDTFMNSPHTCINGTCEKLDTNDIELKHFFTKTLEEWISKFNQNVDNDYINRFRGKVLSTFFFDGNRNVINVITEEKMKAIPKLLEKYNVKYNPIMEENDSEIIELYKKYNNL